MQSYNYDTAPSSSKGKEPAIGRKTASSQPFDIPRKRTTTRSRVSHSTFTRPEDLLTPSRTTGDIGVLEGQDIAGRQSSTTWTSSSGDMALVTDADTVDSRQSYVEEYNRLARKYGIRPIFPGDFAAAAAALHPTKSLPERKGNWLTRVLRQTSNDQSKPTLLHHRRSISDIALTFVHNQKKNGLKNQDLRVLVRLCGKSVFYLPTEYAPSSLVLPTCLRATAQYLVQNAATRGIFRVPGSIRIVNALYDYYCADQKAEEIATTTRCPTLPSHLNCGVHDVASTFKRLLAGLPGGILGSLALFDALIAIHSQLQGEPEYNKTKMSKVRSRLIALAIGTVKSQYQRELICAVFGLLSLVGRVAENAPREDATGRPLPTSDLMGYDALAVMFGPLLVGDLINTYSMKIAYPQTGLVLLPLTPPKSKKSKSKQSKETPAQLLTVDRILVANDITEMLIVNWRDVVRHLKNLNVVHSRKSGVYTGERNRKSNLRSSVSDSFSLRRPPDWSSARPPGRFQGETSSPSAISPAPSSRHGLSRGHKGHYSQDETLSIQRQRSRPSGSVSMDRFTRSHSLNVLSPTAEESPACNYEQKDSQHRDRNVSFTPVSYKRRQDEQAQELATDDATERQKPDVNAGLLASRRATRSSQSEMQNPPSKTLNLSAVGKAHQADVRHTAGVWRSEHEGKTRGLNHIPGAGGVQTHRSKPRAGEGDANEDSDAFTKNSQGRQTPSKHGQIMTSRMSTEFLESSGSLDDPQTANYTVQTRKSEDIDLLGVLSPDERPVEPVLSEDDHASPLSRLEKFPSFHPSVVADRMSTSEEVVGNSYQERIREDGSRVQHVSPQGPTAESPKEMQAQNSQRQEPSAKDEPNTPKRRLSPMLKWKELVRRSPTSSAVSTKEKRLLRYSGRDSDRRSDDSLCTGDHSSKTPEWKRQILSRRLQQRGRPTVLSPEKMSIFEKDQGSTEIETRASPTRSMRSSPAKASSDLGNRTLSHRSTSKPLTGAVKAMAARFDNAQNETPDGRRITLTGRAQSDLRASDSFRSQPSRGDSPKKSGKSNNQVAVTPDQASRQNQHGSIPQSTATPNRTYKSSIARLAQGLKHSTPRSFQNPATKFPKVELRPTSMLLAAARKEPIATTSQAPRERELSRPPSLGTMVPHREEPPVAHHLNLARPQSTASSAAPMPNRRDNIATLDGSPLLSAANSPGPNSGNSLLHAQIRSLQRQLESRNEEIVQLRRQLETRANMDIGTLSEQLRHAKRECAMWRDRAEAAEKRVAAFERFTTKLRGLKRDARDAAKGGEADTGPSIVEMQGSDGGTLDSSSSCAEHTEDEQMFMDRIRSNIQKHARPGLDGLWDINADDGNDTSSTNFMTRRDDLVMRNISERTALLWMAAEELLSSQDESE